jgi:hypothetical protein
MPPASTESQPNLTVASHVENVTDSQPDEVAAGQAETVNPERSHGLSMAHVEPKASDPTPVLRIVRLDADSPELDDASPRDSLSRQQVQRGIELLRTQLVACAGDRHGTSLTQLTISPEGRVTHSLIEGAFAGTPAGSCMARALRGARFPRFASEAFTVRYPFRL